MQSAELYPLKRWNDEVTNPDYQY